MPNCSSSSLYRLMRGKAGETKRERTCLSLHWGPRRAGIFVFCPDFRSRNLKTIEISKTTAMPITDPRRL